MWTWDPFGRVGRPESRFLIEFASRKYFRCGKLCFVGWPGKISG